MNKYLILFFILFFLFQVGCSQKAENMMKFNTLTLEEENVIMHKGTERPYTGEYENNQEDGIYTCKQWNYQQEFVFVCQFYKQEHLIHLSADVQFFQKPLNVLQVLLLCISLPFSYPINFIKKNATGTSGGVSPCYHSTFSGS